MKSVNYIKTHCMYNTYLNVRIVCLLKKYAFKQIHLYQPNSKKLHLIKARLAAKCGRVQFAVTVLWWPVNCMITVKWRINCLNSKIVLYTRINVSFHSLHTFPFFRSMVLWGVYSESFICVLFNDYNHLYILCHRQRWLHRFVFKSKSF